MTTLREAFVAAGLQDDPSYSLIVEAIRSQYLGINAGPSAGVTSAPVPSGSTAVTPTCHSERRAKAAARLALYRDDFAAEVESMIETIYSHPDVKADRRRVAKMIGFLNAPKRITDEVASLYNIPAKRRFPEMPKPTPAADATEQPPAPPNPQAEKFQAVEREIDLHSVMKEAHRLTFWLNETLLWNYEPPGGRKQLRIITPDRFDVVPHPLDALDLVAVVLDVTPAWYPTSLLSDRTLLPHWEIWDSEVKIVIDGAGRKISAEPHGHRRIPGVLMHSRLPVDRLLEDRAGEDILAAARAVLMLNLCTLSLSRDASENQVILKGNLAEMAADQPKTAGRPLALPPGVDASMLNMVTNPEHLLVVIRAVIASVAQSYGMSYEQFTFQETADTASGKAYSVRRAKLTEMRVEQRQRAIVHERDVMDLLGFGDALAPDFHEQEAPADAVEEMDLLDKRCARGLDNPIAWMQRKDTDLSPEQAMARWLANLNVNGMLFTLLRQKNLSLTADASAPGQSPEANGAQGGEHIAGGIKTAGNDNDSQPASGASTTATEAATRGDTATAA